MGRLRYRPVTELLLARHGETDWNRERRWQGHADPPLNELGRAQARRLAEALAGEQLEAIYASDLRRAHETAEIVGARLGLPVTSDPDLREIDVGSWSGLTPRGARRPRLRTAEAKEEHAERGARGGSTDRRRPSDWARARRDARRLAATALRRRRPERQAGAGELRALSAPAPPD